MLPKQETIDNLLKIEAYAKENGIALDKASIALGFGKSYHSTNKARYNNEAFVDFCEAKGLDIRNVTHGWYKGEHIGKDKISLFVKNTEQAEQVQYISDHLIATIKEVAQPPLEKIPQHNYKQPIILELNLYDCHFGKQDFLTDEGTKETAERFKQSIVQFVQFALANYKIQGITIAIGNDLFNVDNIQKTTTKGTPQDQDMPFEKMFIFVQKLVIETLLSLSRIAPLDVVMVRGNHDYSSVFMLGQVLEAYFSNHVDVRIDNGLGRKIRFFGNTAVGLAHGEKDIMKFPALIFREFSKEIFEYQKQGTMIDYYEWHCGHWHGLKTTIQEHSGVITRFFSSLSVNDRWHYNEGYFGNRVSASALIHSLKNGVLSTQTIMF